VRTNWFGGHPYTFGPRHFLTQNRAVYDYDIPNRTVWLKGEKKSFDVIINAISPDELGGRGYPIPIGVWR
jgi:hypothetical protein